MLRTALICCGERQDRVGGFSSWLVNNQNDKMMWPLLAERALGEVL